MVYMGLHLPQNETHIFFLLNMLPAILSVQNRLRSHLAFELPRIGAMVNTARVTYHPYAGLLLGQRRRRWPNNKATLCHHIAHCPLNTLCITVQLTATISQKALTAHFSSGQLRLLDSSHHTSIFSLLISSPLLK